VDIKKQNKLIQLTKIYLSTKNINDIDIRFDVVEIMPYTMRIFKNAFEVE